MKVTRSWRVVTGLSLAILGAMGNGCSFVYTKGPQPELHPPPACTTSNDAPIADTLFAAASVGVAVAGGIIANNTKNCGGFPCGAVNGLTGDGMIILGAIGALVFIPSAAVGYNRTAACRAWLQGGAKPISATPQRAENSHGSWLLAPTPECSRRGDAPLLCASSSL